MLSILTEEDRMEDPILPEQVEPPVPTVQEQEEVGLEVGDTIYLLGGRLNKTRGILYGFRSDRFIILPSGVSDRVITIPLTMEGVPDPDLGLVEILLLKKTEKPGFINLLDMRAEQKVETFDSSGTPGPRFTVQSVNEVEDSAVFVDELGKELPLDFDFKGIPGDFGYDIIRVREEVEDLSPTDGIEKVSDAPPLTLQQEDVDAEGEIPRASELDATPPDASAMTFELGEEVELPMDEEIQEVSSALRTYPDVFQRSEMLSQLIRILPQTQQRSPLKLLEVRRLVEMMLYLRNDIVRYGVTGEPRGAKATSVGTLAELLQKTNVHLSRKVTTDLTKVYYRETYGTAYLKEHPELTNPTLGQLENGVFALYTNDSILEAISLEEKANAEPTDEQGSTKSDDILVLPKMYRYLQGYSDRIFQPYMSNGPQEALEDVELFYESIPSFQDKPVLGLVQEDADPVPTPTLMQLPYSMVKVLKGRSTKFGKREIRVEKPETFESITTLLFPRMYLRELGPIRSGILAQDISLGMTPPKTMHDILRTLGDPTDFPTQNGLLVIGYDGILGNVRIEDWLQSQHFPLYGFRDVHRVLKGYGISSIEWTVEQSAVLQKKIELTLASLRMYISSQREQSKTNLANLRFDPNPLLPGDLATRLVARVESEPLLQKLLEDVRLYMGDLALVDVNWFSYIFTKAQDLLLTTLGQQAQLVARERLRYVRDQYLDALYTGYRLRKKQEDSGQPPQQNMCVHVTSLEKVRKVQDEKEKMKLLAKYLGEFRSHTKDNWVHCSICDEHLLCAHELLQIQQFMNPKEQDALYKQMVLLYSGESEGRFFLCKNCGQPLQEMDFDTNLEFDDEGRPMMGRAVMKEEEDEDEEFERILRGPVAIDKEEEEIFDQSNQPYRVLKRIASLVGIRPEKKDYVQMVEDLSTYLNSLATREIYARETKGKKAPEYDVYSSIRFVSAAAAILLLNIQSHIPEYTIYFTSVDCNAGFGGYPLDMSDTTMAGVQCMSLVLAGINDNEEPWNLTTLQKQTNLLKRRDILVTFLRGQLDSFLKNPVPQKHLKEKRDYLLKLHGSVRGKESIPETFRPVPYVLTTEEAAATVVSDTGSSPAKQATAWIRLAHKVAKADASQTETSCCYYPMKRPGSFWTDKQLPTLSERSNKFSTGPRAITLFHTEPSIPIIGTIDPENYYHLFARLCWQGENKGLPHELGLTLTCSQCMLHFSEHPSAWPAEGLKLRSEMEGQGVVITKDTFEDLLTTSHLKHSVRRDTLVQIPRAEQTLQTLANLSPAPLENWADSLQTFQVAMVELGSSISKIQIATAAEKLVQNIGEKEEYLQLRLGKDIFAILQEIASLPPRECGEVLTTYLIVPFQRYLYSMDNASMDWGLQNIRILDPTMSVETKTDILKKGLGTHNKPILQGSESLSELAVEKMKHLIRELSSACKHVFPYLRHITTPGGETMVRYIVRAYVMGPIQTYLDPHKVPVSDSNETSMNIKLLYRALTEVLTKYVQGSAVPSEAQIRVDLEKRVEAEKQYFINRMDKMNRDQRKVSLINKTLGIGEWAVGGTNAIRKYDAERYEVERAERAMAGIEDYPEQGQGQGQEQETLDGYDHDQMREDEY